MNNNLPDAPDDKKIPFLLGVRDNLLKPMKKEIVASIENGSKECKRLIVFIAALTMINTVAIIILIWKSCFKS